LTAQQESFAQAVASGKSQSEAYRTAYPRSREWKQTAVNETASRTASNPTVFARIAALRREVAERSLWSREQSVAILAEIAQAAEKDSDRVQAVKELNAMHGFEAAKKVDLQARVHEVRIVALSNAKR